MGLAIAPLSCRQCSIRQLRPPSVLRYTPDMSDAQNISFGSCGELAGTKIPPPPPSPTLTHSFSAAAAGRRAGRDECVPRPLESRPPRQWLPRSRSTSRNASVSLRHFFIMVLAVRTPETSSTSLSVADIGRAAMDRKARGLQPPQR